MKKIIIILILALVGCREKENCSYVRETLNWKVTNVVVCKYSYVEFNTIWRGIVLHGRSFSSEGYYYKRFKLKYGDNVQQMSTVYICRDGHAVKISAGELHVKAYIK